MERRERVQKALAWLIQKGVAATQKELAVQLGYKESSLSQIVNGHVPVSDKFLGRMALLDRQLNREWLITGKGEMVLTARDNDTSLILDDDSEAVFFGENTTGAKFYRRGTDIYMNVRHVPYAAFGQFANDSDRLEPTEEEWTTETYLVDHPVRGHYLSFEVKGDSMDTGTRNSFEAGDRVLCRELERDLWANPIRFVERPYWVVVFDTSVLLKQIISHDLEHGTLTFHSLNPSPEYADFTLRQDEIRALYYVIKKKPREVKFLPALEG